VILVDANLLLYAQDSRGENYEAARAWWIQQLSGTETVGLAWSVIAAFVRVGTHPRVYQQPQSLKEAIAHVQSWLNQSCVRIVEPTDQHWVIFQKMLIEGNAVANLVTDAHLAALAVEHECELCSTDADFARFPGLKWRNPLAAK
jgi:uncharacterized protein